MSSGEIAEKDTDHHIEPPKSEIDCGLIRVTIVAPWYGLVLNYSVLADQWRMTDPRGLSSSYWRVVGIAFANANCDKLFICDQKAIAGI